MIFYIGAILFIVSIIMLVRVLRNSRRPRIDGARVLEITQDFYVHKGNRSPRKFPHARVEYYYDGAKREAKILLKSKPKPGDGIQLSVNPTNPSMVEEYYPFKETLVAFGIMALGAVLMICSFVLMQRLNE
jgi:hypothetical protein